MVSIGFIGVLNVLGGFIRFLKVSRGFQGATIVLIVPNAPLVQYVLAAPSPRQLPYGQTERLQTSHQLRHVLGGQREAVVTGRVTSGLLLLLPQGRVQVLLGAKLEVSPGYGFLTVPHLRRSRWRRKSHLTSSICTSMVLSKALSWPELNWSSSLSRLCSILWTSP